MLRGAQTSCRALESIDRIDCSIIKQLAKNGRKKLTLIGKEVNLRHSTVKERLDRLLASNIIKIQANINVSKLNLKAMIVEVEFDSVENAIKFVKRLERCSKVFMMAIRAEKKNVLVVLVDSSYDSLMAFIDKNIRCADGVKDFRASLAVLFKPEHLPLDLECGVHGYSECMSCVFMRDLNMCSGCQIVAPAR